MSEFFDDVNNGNLPFFSWLDPSWVDDIIQKANDQHPDHDVTQGETLLKKIYETLRASRYFNDTLLIVFYDEHGGFFDHVSPPHAPNPDGINTTDQAIPFGFDRYGMRIPVVMINPYIPKAIVASKPELGVNIPQYSTSSMIRTIREQFTPGVPPFTKRDGYSLSFENIVSLDTPRTDCPMTLPDVPKSEGKYVYTQGLQGTSEYHRSLARTIAPLCGMKHDDKKLLRAFVNQNAMAKFYKECVNAFLKAHKQ